MSASLEPPYALDAGGMAGRIESIPSQIREALDALRERPWRPPIAGPDLLAVGAMGGSAIAADLVAAEGADRLPRPILVTRDYRWPACVTTRSLALLCSYSGDTEETLALYREAQSRGIPRLALTTGGALAARCARDRVSCLSLPGGSPPRAALFSAWVRLSLLLHTLGWSDDPVPAWREAADHLERGNERLGPAAPEERNPAKRLARALHGRHVYVYAAAGPAGAVATRWRQQLNENAKLLAHSAVVPELNHNEIVGWEKPAAFARGVAVVVLRDAEDLPEHGTRLALTAEYAATRGAVVHSVESSGPSRAARVASLVQWGDFVSLYLALLGGVDPTPIASIDEFKRRLAAEGVRRVV